MRYPDGAVNRLPYRRDQNGQQDGLELAKVNRNDVTQVRVK